MSKKILALIPARMGSSRFPGKPMAKIHGTPMIGHVYKGVIKNQSLSMAAVATCDEEIKNYIESIGGYAIMTSQKHERASDRCAEALIEAEKKYGDRFDIVVMVQGDEPMVNPEMIDEALAPFSEDSSVEIVNLLGKFDSEEEFLSRNSIKVVCDLNGNAIYFSRQPIPDHGWKADSDVIGKQVCIMPFSRDFLLEYSNLSPTPLEIVESIDMLRVIEHGRKVKMQPTSYSSVPVDTPLDLARVEGMIDKINIY
jgi:3-deoxy-manno-octulosonate cytidylyltransferase (CMP-KDO synthetase)